MRTERAMAWRGVAFRAVMLVAGLVLGAMPLAAQATDSIRAHPMTWGRETFVMSEVLEIAPDAAGRPLGFDLVGWSGGALRRVWAKADGGVATQGGGSHGEYQLLYGWLVSPWWDFQLGVRVDHNQSGSTSASRGGAVIALQGLAPGWFEVEPSIFIATDGSASLDLTASYDVFLTQRLVLQPRVETSVALRDDVAFGIGRGVGPSSLALRTRYEIRREFAPYVGVVWERRFGRTADLAGGDAGETALVAGLRLWW